MIIMDPAPLDPWQTSVLDEIEQLNEKLLRFVEQMERLPCDKRALAVAKTHMQTATLWLGAAVSPWPRLADPEIEPNDRTV